MALVTIFAESRWKGIKAAVHEKKPWPPTWLADVDAAYAVLRKHPLGTDSQVLWHYDFLVWLGADHHAAQVLAEGIERFTDSVPLHQRFRNRLLAREGAEKMQDAYDALLKEHGPSATLASFAGLGSVAAAEDYRRHRKWDDAVEAYGRAVAHYEEAAKAEPAFQAASDRAIALALAGEARVLFEIGKDAEATDVSLTGIARDPQATATQDGMGMTPGETAQAILSQCRRNGEDDLADRIEKVFSTLDPDLLPTERD